MNHVSSLLKGMFCPNSNYPITLWYRDVEWNGGFIFSGSVLMSAFLFKLMEVFDNFKAYIYNTYICNACV